MTLGCCKIFSVHLISIPFGTENSNVSRRTHSSNSGKREPRHCFESTEAHLLISSSANLKPLRMIKLGELLIRTAKNDYKTYKHERPPPRNDILGAYSQLEYSPINLSRSSHGRENTW